jgi:hypothetical protein
MLSADQEEVGEGPLQLPVLKFITYFASINTVHKKSKFTPIELL